LRDIDCRILCATNRDLAVEVEASRFRQDLYYRLRVLEVELPPLRGRLEDLPLLCRHLLAPFGDFNLQPEVIEFLARYPWPGNIRELRNTLERMAVMARPAGAARGGRVQLRLQDVPLDIRGAVQGGTPAPAPVAGTAVSGVAAAAPQESAASGPAGFVVPGPEYPPLEEIQVSYARWVLDQCNGNKSKAAKMLGIQRSTLYSWTEWKDKK
jgi:DNA-binding NtrC family response regulator